MACRVLFFAVFGLRRAVEVGPLQSAPGCSPLAVGLGSVRGVPLRPSPPHWLLLLPLAAARDPLLDVRGVDLPVLVLRNVPGGRMSLYLPPQGWHPLVVSGIVGCRPFMSTQCATWFHVYSSGLWSPRFLNSARSSLFVALFPLR